MSQDTRTPKAPKPPQFFEVPARTPRAECKGCRATIYWITTAAGKSAPIDCDVEGGVRPSSGTAPLGGVQYFPGRGVSHFATCPQAAGFRRRR